MDRSAFDTAIQNKLSYKIALGLERVSEAFKALLWEHAKVSGLSPIQMQILIFTAYHKIELCNVSYLAKEFNVTKPTISDAVKALFKKELIDKESATGDHRSYNIKLNQNGRQLLKDIDQFANPIVSEIEKLNSDSQQEVYSVLQQLIYNLNRKGILQIQRSCFGCRFYQKSEQGRHYCNFLEKPLATSDIRLDCPEFESIA